MVIHSLTLFTQIQLVDIVTAVVGVPTATNLHLQTNTCNRGAVATVRIINWWAGPIFLFALALFDSC